jgi:hypothetical protein
MFLAMVSRNASGIFPIVFPSDKAAFAYKHTGESRFPRIAQTAAAKNICRDVICNLVYAC